MVTVESTGPGRVGTEERPDGLAGNAAGGGHHVMHKDIAPDHLYDTDVRVRGVSINLSYGPTLDAAA
jgi:hypothetical protein